jgi:hypothetical protein
MDLHNAGTLLPYAQHYEPNKTDLGSKQQLLDSYCTPTREPEARENLRTYTDCIMQAAKVCTLLRQRANWSGLVPLLLHEGGGKWKGKESQASKGARCCPTTSALRLTCQVSQRLD